MPVENFQAIKPHVAVSVNQVEHRAQITVAKIRLGRRKLVSETLVVGLELSYDAGRLVIECGAQGLVGDWVHCLCGVCSYCGVFNITI